MRLFCLPVDVTPPRSNLSSVVTVIVTDDLIDVLLDDREKARVCIRARKARSAAANFAAIVAARKQMAGWFLQLFAPRHVQWVDQL